MLKAYKEIDTTCKVLQYYSLIVTMVVLICGVFLVQLFFGYDSFGGAISGMYQIVIASLTAIILVTSFSANYQMLLSTPFKIGTVATQIFSIFELICTISFAFILPVSIMNCNKFIVVFQIINYFASLLIGYVMINLMSNAELNFNARSKFAVVWLISFFVSVLIYVGIMLINDNLLGNMLVFKLLCVLCGVLMIATFILRIILRRSATNKIRAMKFSKKKIKT